MVIGNDWDYMLELEFKDKYYLDIKNTLKQEYEAYTIYPEIQDIFNAFKLSSFIQTRVVILGQDPYINPGQANGLAFSVKKETPIPPSEFNIFLEIQNTLGFPIPEHGDLTCWAKQGILLLNSILTVRKGLSGSHKHIGWEIFTDSVIKYLNVKIKPVIYLLWGKFAQTKIPLITNKDHYILTAPHPSPLAGNKFLGCDHFRKTNEILISHKLDPIDWRIE